MTDRNKYQYQKLLCKPLEAYFAGQPFFNYCDYHSRDIVQCHKGYQRPEQPVNLAEQEPKRSPYSSGNDFVKVFDDPKAFYDLDRLLDAKETEFDLIKVNGDYSLNICSVGLDARIGTDVSNYKRFSLLQGFWAYAVSTLVNVLRGIGEHYIVELNGETIDGQQTMICVCNGRFYGGGFNPVPEADPRDGILEVLVVKKVSRLQVPGVVGKYKAGKYRELTDLIRHFRTNRLTIHCDAPTPINLDGELRWARDIEISVAPEKLRFFHPKDTAVKQMQVPACP